MIDFPEKKLLIRSLLNSQQGRVFITLLIPTSTKKVYNPRYNFIVFVFAYTLQVQYCQFYFFTSFIFIGVDSGPKDKNCDRSVCHISMTLFFVSTQITYRSAGNEETTDNNNLANRIYQTSKTRQLLTMVTKNCQKMLETNALYVFEYIQHPYLCANEFTKLSSVKHVR